MIEYFYMVGIYASSAHTDMVLSPYRNFESAIKSARDLFPHHSWFIERFEDKNGYQSNNVIIAQKKRG